MHSLCLFLLPGSRDVSLGKWCAVEQQPNPVVNTMKWGEPHSRAGQGVVSIFHPKQEGGQGCGMTGYHVPEGYFQVLVLPFCQNVGPGVEAGRQTVVNPQKLVELSPEGRREPGPPVGHIHYQNRAALAVDQSP